jgi:hypothetical protein
MAGAHLKRAHGAVRGRTILFCKSHTVREKCDATLSRSIKCAIFQHDAIAFFVEQAAAEETWQANDKKVVAYSRVYSRLPLGSRSSFP